MSNPELYLVEISYRDRAGRFDPYFREIDTAAANREQVIKDICSGEYEDVSRVLCIDLAQGTARDATADIARDVLGVLREPPPAFLANWLDDVLGAGATDRFVDYMERA